MPPIDLKDALHSSPLFCGMDDRDLDALVASGRRVEYDARETIFFKDDPGDALLVILEGQVLVTVVSEEGDEVLLNLVRPGEVVGEIALLDGGPRSADARAGTKTKALLIRRGDFLALAKQNPLVSLGLVEFLCRRLREMSCFAEDLVLLDLGPRLVHRLRALAGEQLWWGDLPVRIVHGLSQQELGETVGITRVSVNKQLSAWRKSGWIQYGRGYLEIRDRDALETISGD